MSYPLQLGVFARNQTWLALPLLLTACTGVPIDRRGPPQQSEITRTYNIDFPTLHQRILTEVTQLPAPFSKMKVIELKPPNYPPDWLATWVDAKDFLAPYKALSAAQRSDDLMLEEPTGDVYWSSEYYAADGPVKFHSSFILHFDPLTARSTKVQVYEKVPQVWAGETWALSRHGIGFGKYHDIRFVEPTVKDRQDLLEALNKLVTY